MSASDQPRDPSAIVGIGASAGGVEALIALVRKLPPDLPAAILVVLHMPATGTSALAEILARAGPLPAVTAQDGDPVRAGVVQVAPANRHLILEDGRLRVLAGPRENGHRPAIDPTFRSIASVGPRGVGVILSGARDDGTLGLLAIKQAGGRTLVQDPDEALFDGMIRSALRYVQVDGILSVADIAKELTALSRRLGEMNDDRTNAARNEHDSPTATRYTCPDCGGALWRYEDAAAVRFECSVGHAYSADSLDGEQGRDLEARLWAAVRLLGDRRTLLGELAERAARMGSGRSARAFREKAAEAERAADAIRGLIEDGHLPLETVMPTEEA